MAMTVKLTTVGNSTGIVLPRELLEKLLSWVDRQDEIVADSLARMAA